MIGSISKQFTAAAILLLEEDGALSTDDLVAEHLPDFAHGDKVTLEQLPRAIASQGGRWVERDGHRAQYHILTFLGSSWCRGEKPQLPDERIIALVHQVKAKGGGITFDVPIQKGGLIPAPFVRQLEAIGKAMR